MKAGVCELLTKIVKFRPRIVCFLAKSVWEIFIGELYRASHTPVSKPTKIIRTPRGETSRSQSLVSSQFFPKEEAVSAGHASQASEQPTSPLGNTEKVRSRSSPVPKHSFAWGVQPFKLEHRQSGTSRAIVLSSHVAHCRRVLYNV